MSQVIFKISRTLFAITALILFSIYFYRKYKQKKVEENNIENSYSLSQIKDIYFLNQVSLFEEQQENEILISDRHFLQKLNLFFPQKKIPEHLQLQLLLNLKQGGSREGVLSYFLDNLQYSSDEERNGDQVSVAQKLVINELYQQYFFSILKYKSSSYKANIVTDLNFFLHELEKKNQDAARAWSQHVANFLSNCVHSDDLKYSGNNLSSDHVSIDEWYSFLVLQVLSCLTIGK